MNKVIATKQFLDKTFDADFEKSAIIEFLQANMSPKKSISQIFEMVVKAIDRFGLLGDCRKRQKVYMRNYLYYYLHTRAKQGVCSIAHLFGKHWTSVKHGLETYETFKSDDLFLSEIAPLLDFLKANDQINQSIFE